MVSGVHCDTASLIGSLCNDLRQRKEMPEPFTVETLGAGAEKVAGHAHSPLEADMPSMSGEGKQEVSPG